MMVVTPSEQLTTFGSIVANKVSNYSALANSVALQSNQFAASYLREARLELQQ